MTSEGAFCLPIGAGLALVSVGFASWLGMMPSPTVLACVGAAAMVFAGVSELVRR